MKLVLLAAVLVFGCSKKSDSGGGGAAAGPPCTDVGKGVDALPGGPGGGEVQAKLKTILVTRCTEDKWPAATIECYATQVKDMMGMRKCRETLAPELQQKLQGEIRAVMMGAAGAGGGPMHGAPPAGSGN